MQATIYKYGAGRNNFYALLAAIYNPKLSSNQALSYFGLGCKENAIIKPKRRTTQVPKNLNIQEIRAEYEAGATIKTLRTKYMVGYNFINLAIEQAGGTVRSRGCARINKIDGGMRNE